MRVWTRKAAKAAAEERTLDALVIVASTSPLLLLSSLPLVCARLRADTKIEAERIRTAGRMILCLLRRATPKVYFREFDKPVTYATFLSELDQAYEDVMLVMIADRNLPISDETTDLLERSLQRLSDRIGRFAERSNIKVFDGDYGNIDDENEFPGYTLRFNKAGESMLPSLAIEANPLTAYLKMHNIATPMAELRHKDPEFGLWIVSSDADEDNNDGLNNHGHGFGLSFDAELYDLLTDFPERIDEY